MFLFKMKTQFPTDKWIHVAPSVWCLCFSMRPRVNLKSVKRNCESRVVSNAGLEFNLTLLGGHPVLFCCSAGHMRRRRHHLWSNERKLLKVNEKLFSPSTLLPPPRDSMLLVFITFTRAKCPLQHTA